MQHGPSSELVSHINHLGALLQNLPSSLPLDPPESSYSFGLGNDDITTEGVWYAHLMLAG
jgi:hypothetical protein